MAFKFNPFLGTFTEDTGLTQSQADALYRQKITKVLVVDPSGKGDYTTIASALDDAESGYHIKLMPGTYNEYNLDTPNGVSIEGKNATISTVTDQPVLLPQGNNHFYDLEIIGLIPGGNDGVCMRDRDGGIDNVYFHNCEFQSGYDTIQVFQTTSNNWIFDGCNFSRADYDGGNLSGSNILFKDCIFTFNPTYPNTQCSIMNVVQGSTTFQNCKGSISRPFGAPVSFVRLGYDNTVVTSSHNIIDVFGETEAYGFFSQIAEKATRVNSYEDTINLTANNIYHAYAEDNWAEIYYRGGNMTVFSGINAIMLTSGYDAKYQAKETGKGLSTNDFTDAAESKLAGIEAGANVYTTEMAQDAVGAMIGSSLQYVDATPLLNTIQDIRTTATPQFAKLGVGAPASAVNQLLTQMGWTGQGYPTNLYAYLAPTGTITQTGASELISAKAIAGFTQNFAAFANTSEKSAYLYGLDFTVKDEATHTNTGRLNYIVYGARLYSYITNVTFGTGDLNLKSSGGAFYNYLSSDYFNATNNNYIDACAGEFATSIDTTFSLWTPNNVLSMSGIRNDVNVSFGGEETTKAVGIYGVKNTIQVTDYDYSFYGAPIKEAYSFYSEFPFYPPQAIPFSFYSVNGNWSLNSDDDKFLIGATRQHSIYSDGDDLIINTAEVGTGILKLAASTNWSDSAPTGGTTRYLRVKDDNGNVYKITAVLEAA